MTRPPTMAERLDRAVGELLAGESPETAAATARLSGSDGALVQTAASLRTALSPSVISPHFEARLAARLSGAAPAAWIIRHSGRLIVTGAVGSAVGVGVTAYAVWRSTRRSAGGPHWLLHR